MIILTKSYWSEQETLMYKDYYIKYYNKGLKRAQRLGIPFAKHYAKQYAASEAGTILELLHDKFDKARAKYGYEAIEEKIKELRKRYIPVACE